MTLAVKVAFKPNTTNQPNLLECQVPQTTVSFLHSVPKAEHLVYFVSETCEWKRLETDGNRPGARDGHTSCVIKKKMYLFGGYEDAVSIT